MDNDLEKLKKDLEAAQPPKKPSGRDTLKPKTPMGKMLNVGVELVAGVLVGVALGLLIDWYFETSPFGLIILFILGSGAGMLNVFRALTTRQREDKNDKETGSHDG